MASIPENYFAEYTGEGAAELLPTLPEHSEPHWENQHREFKSGDLYNQIVGISKAIRNGTPVEGEKDKNKALNVATGRLAAAWSELLAAFATTGGGVVVFGIHAQSEKNLAGISVDKPHSVRLVQEPQGLVTMLKKLALDATDPPISIPDPKIVYPAGKIEEGFVVCLIPEGKQKPYRALRAEKEFYIRNDDSCISPNMSLLRQLFNPSRYYSAALKLTYVEGEPENRALFGIELKNTGRLSLKALRLKCQSRDCLLEFNCASPMGGTTYAPFLDGSFHPDDQSYVEIAVSQASGRYVKIKFVLFAEDCPSVAAEVTLESFCSPIEVHLLPEV